MKIQITDDFDLFKITYSGQCFRPVRLDNDIYRFITGDKVLFIKHVSDNEYVVSCTKEEWENVWHHYFDLDTNYLEIRNSINPDDHFLTNSSKVGTGIRILNQDKFEMLISFIISQRKSIPAIKSSVEKICSMFGHQLELTHDTDFQINQNEAVFSFPTAEELFRANEDELKACGLGYRVPYIMEAVSRIISGELNLDAYDSCDDCTLLCKLKELYGVGEKVANCVSLFGFHRIGSAPIDTWISKVIDYEYNGVNPFGQYPQTAGIMQQYMFYASQHEKLLNIK